MYLEHYDKTLLDRAELSLKNAEFMTNFLPTPDVEDWYGWRMEHWGIKWDIEVNTMDRTEFVLKAIYDSAWAPPIMFYHHLCRIGFRVRSLYYEPDGQFCGIFDNGNDDYYDLTRMNAKEIKEKLPKELEQEFGILGYFSESQDSDSD